ncbi:hypothetical protein BH24ACT7_BH24ACT7_26380 [soil metagenome]
MTALVFDTSVLSHFARAGQLDTLRNVTDGFRRVTPAEVMREVVAGISEHPGLASTVGVDWIDVVELELVSELVAFARYKTEFGGGPERNNGEAAVLAWASVHGGTVIVDDAVAARAARRGGISVHGTLWLVANGVRFGVLVRDDAEHIVDDLAATEMRLPVDGRGFFAWAYETGLLP